MTATGYAFPRLRDDLVYSSQTTSYGVTVVLKDPVVGRYFRFGETEEFIARQFDGATPPDEIRRRTESKFGAALSAPALEAFTKSLLSAGLFESADGSRRRKRSAWVHGSLLRVQVRAFDPDRLFTRMQPYIGWCYAKATLVFTAAVVALAIMLAASSWSAIAAESVALLRLSSIPILLLAIFIILSAHEFAHGLTCKRFGGAVHEVGFMLIYFQPAFYCDVSDAWLIPEKWKRVAVSIAGPLMELALWGGATLAWYVTERDTMVHSLALIVMACTGVHTLLNFNPFLKLDGYYILSDLVGIPNLRRRAFAHVGQSVKRLFGIDVPDGPALTRRESNIFLAYGAIASAGTFALVGFILFSFGEALAEGRQPILMAFVSTVVGLRFRKRLRRLFGAAAADDDEDEDDIVDSQPASTTPRQPAPEAATPTPEPVTKERSPKPKRSRWRRYWKRRLAWMTLAAAAIGFIALGRLQLRISGTFTALPEHNADIRSEIEAIVDEVLMTEGATIQEGDVVVRLSAREATSQLQALNADISRAEARLRLLQLGTSKDSIALGQTVVEGAREALKYAEARYARTKQLAEGGFATKMEAETAQEAADLARNTLAERENRLRVLAAGARPEELAASRAELARLEAQRRLVASTLQLVDVRSPASGVVATPARQLRELRGQLVPKGALLAKVFDVEALKVEIAVPEKEIGDVHVGHPVLIRARAFPGRVFEGTVVSIAPAVAGSVRPAADDAPASQAPTATSDGKSVLVTTMIDNKELLLKPGMTGQAKILAGIRPVRSLIWRRVQRTLNFSLWTLW